MALWSSDLTRAATDQLARQLLQNHSHSVAFPVDIEDERDTDDLALAFEMLGCSVERTPGKTLLSVTKPKQLNA